MGNELMQFTHWRVKVIYQEIKNEVQSQGEENKTGIALLCEEDRKRD